MPTVLNGSEISEMEKKRQTTAKSLLFWTFQ